MTQDQTEFMEHANTANEKAKELADALACVTSDEAFVTLLATFVNTAITKRVHARIRPDSGAFLHVYSMADGFANMYRSIVDEVATKAIEAVQAPKIEVVS